MIQPKVTIRNKKTKAEMQVNKSLAGDYIGTGEFELVEDNKKEEKKPTRDFNIDKNRE